MIHQIKEGFPKTRNSVNTVLQPFLEVRHHYTACHNIISMDDTVVIPTSLQKQIFHMLHSAHHEVANVAAPANVSVYWQKINNSICTIWYNCKNCNKMGPLNPKEPLFLSLPPEWPFHRMCADFLQKNGLLYLSVVDMFRG